MVKVVRRHYKKKKVKGGTNKSLSANDETLMMLEYYREYKTSPKTFFNIWIYVPTQLL